DAFERFVGQSEFHPSKGTCRLLWTVGGHVEHLLRCRLHCVTEKLPPAAAPGEGESLGHRGLPDAVRCDQQEGLPGGPCDLFTATPYRREFEGRVEGESDTIDQTPSVELFLHSPAFL